MEIIDKKYTVNESNLLVYTALSMLILSIIITIIYGEWRGKNRTNRRRKKETKEDKPKKHLI